MASPLPGPFEKTSSPPLPKAPLSYTTPKPHPLAQPFVTNKLPPSGMNSQLKQNILYTPTGNASIPNYKPPVSGGFYNPARDLNRWRFASNFKMSNGLALPN